MSSMRRIGDRAPLHGIGQQRRDLVLIGLVVTAAIVVAFPMLPRDQAVSRRPIASPFFSSVEAAQKIHDGSVVLAYPYSGNPRLSGRFSGYPFAQRYQAVNEALL